MSLERSSQLPGGFQLRHRTLGVYQGTAIDLAFWQPSSGMPEYGLCRFSSREQAERMVAFLSSPACTELLMRGDFTIEPYDLIEHERLTTEHPLPSAWEQPS